MPQDKIKLTKKEFDEMYTIEEITEETQEVPSAKLEDTTPKDISETVLDTYEQQQDDALEESMGWDN